MRVFVAVGVPESARAELEAAVAGLRGRLDGVRWTAPDSWHLTLAFIGEVGEERLPRLAARLERAAARHPAHRLRLAGAGRFGDRALWAGVRGDVRTLGRLAQSAQAAARREGFPGEDRAFRAHLTLARSGGRQRGDHGHGVDLRPAVAALEGFEGTAWTVRRLLLMRSHLGGGPARYEELASWPLAEPSLAGPPGAEPSPAEPSLAEPPGAEPSPAEPSPAETPPGAEPSPDRGAPTDTPPTGPSPAETPPTGPPLAETPGDPR